MKKKGAAQLMGLLLIVIVGFAVWAVFAGKVPGIGGGEPLATTGTGQRVATVQVSPEDVTVTMTSWDKYSKGTKPTQGNLLLESDGLKNTQKNQDGTVTMSPGNKYRALIGNKTTSLTANTDYYPVYEVGTIPDKGTYTISDGLAKSGGSSQLTYYYKNNKDEVATATALGANDEKTVKLSFTISDNVCFGNPAAGGMNRICFQYNSTSGNYDKIEVIDWTVSAGAASRSYDGKKTSVPDSLNAAAEKDEECYEMPVICDNEEAIARVRIDTGATQPTASNHNISVSVYDVSIDYHADTLEILMPVVEDEDGNDIGITDLGTTYPSVYGIAVS